MRGYEIFLKEAGTLAESTAKSKVLCDRLS